MRLDTDGEKLRANLDVIIPDTASSSNETSQSAAGNVCCEKNMDVLSRWNSTFVGDENDRIVTMTEALISIGREDLLDIIWQIREETLC